MYSSKRKTTRITMENNHILSTNDTPKPVLKYKEKSLEMKNASL